MSYHGTNPEFNDYSRHYPNPRYHSLGGMTRAPNAPMLVLDPNDAPLGMHLDAFESGLLNPNQYNPLVAGADYYTIALGYGDEPESLYAERKCSGANGRNRGMNILPYPADDGEVNIMPVPQNGNKILPGRTRRDILPGRTRREGGEMNILPTPGDGAPVAVPENVRIMPVKPAFARMIGRNVPQNIDVSGPVNIY